MGRRAATETIARLLFAFLREPVWTQRRLERHCGIGPKALRRRLLELQEAGIQMEREEDPPHVYWSVPKDWFPKHARGLFDCQELARLIARLPRSRNREAALAQVLGPAVDGAMNPNVASANVDDAVLRILEDAVARRVPVRLGYSSASRGGQGGLRVVSIQRIAYGARVRFVGHCHSTHLLKWFRADRVTSPEVAVSTPYLAAPAADVERFIAESLDGFRDPRGPEVCRFELRHPDATWALRALPDGAGTAVVQHVDGGVRVELATAGLDVLARFLVGLGEACTVHAPDKLRARVVALARGALRAQGGLNVASVRLARAGQIGPQRGAG